MPEPLHIDNAGGGPYLDQDMRLRFVSENVTVTLEEHHATVIANYTFRNMGNRSIEQIILLPFYMEPWNVDLKIEGEPVDHSWDTFDLFEYGLEYFTYEDLSALNFTIELGPGENCTVDISYERYYMISPDKVLRRNFIYLARTGSLWYDPIEYARFRFLVNETMVKGGFEGVPDFNGQDHMLKERVRELVDFLYEEVSTEDGYILLERTYTKWVPETDVGVAWDLYRPIIIMDDSVKVLTDRVQIIFNGSLSYDIDGSIVNYTWKIDEVTFYGKEITIEVKKFGFFHLVMETSDDSGLKTIEHWDYLILPEDDMFTLNLTDLLRGWSSIFPYNIEGSGSSVDSVKWNMEDGTTWEGKEVEIYTGSTGRSEIWVYYTYEDWGQEMFTVEVITLDAELELPVRGSDNDEEDLSFPLFILLGAGGAVFILCIIIFFCTILLVKRKTGNRMRRKPGTE